MDSTGGGKRTRCTALGTRWRPDISHHCRSFAAERGAPFPGLSTYKARSALSLSLAATRADDAGDCDEPYQSARCLGKTADASGAHREPLQLVYARNARCSAGDK